MTYLPPRKDVMILLTGRRPVAVLHQNMQDHMTLLKLRKSNFELVKFEPSCKTKLRIFQLCVTALDDAHITIHCCTFTYHIYTSQVLTD